MSDRTGLGVVEAAALLSLAELGGAPDAGCRKTTRLLDLLEQRYGIGGRYAYPVLQDLQAPYRLHLPLLDVRGNWGSRYGDPAADARYTEVRLSRVGALAVAAERGELGPVPLGLIEGSLYRDGPVPPFNPAAVVAALRTGGGHAGPPVAPTGGTIDGDIPALLRGRGTTLTLGCAIRVEPGALVITGEPLGIPVDALERTIASRSRPGGSAPTTFRVRDVRDESDWRVGVRVRVMLTEESDAAEALAWLHSLWPVTVAVRCRLPAPMKDRLRSWDPGDGSGLAALAEVLAAAD